MNLKYWGGFSPSSPPLVYTFEILMPTSLWSWDRKIFTVRWCLSGPGHVVQQKISHSVLNKQYYLTGFFHSTQIWGILFTTTARNSNALDNCLMLFLLPRAGNSLEKDKRHSTGKTLSTAWIIVIVNWIRSGYHHICRLSLREVNFTCCSQNILWMDPSSSEKFVQVGKHRNWCHQNPSQLVNTFLLYLLL